MYRGEPISLWTNIVAIFMIIPLGIAGLYTALGGDFSSLHYQIAIQLVVGLLIIGSELQFFKALTGLRKYQPEFLRYIYLLLLIVSTLLVFISSFLAWISFLLLILVQFYWISKAMMSKYFKFPLNYFYVAQIYHIIAILLIIINEFMDVVSEHAITHILTIGWLGMVLQGALIRILPLFLGKSLNAQAKAQLKLHFYLSIIATMVLLSGFVLDFVLGYIVGGSIYMLTWGWTLIILAKNLRGGKKVIYPETLLFFLPGIGYFLFGMLAGMLSLPKSIHLHLSFLGLLLIIIGAAHRIIIFQIYTLIYTGRRTDRKESSLMYRKVHLYSGIFSNIAVVALLLAFYTDMASLYLAGGVMAFVGLMLFYSIIIRNLWMYLNMKADAIPFHLTPSEYK